jgi:hypothetical protein
MVDRMRDAGLGGHFPRLAIDRIDLCLDESIFAQDVRLLNVKHPPIFRAAMRSPIFRANIPGGV